MSEPAILYAEDDALSRVVMETLLTRVLGYHNVVIFENSTDFMAKLKALPSLPDVIFLDMNEEVKKLKDAGFDGVIAKPLDADVFPKTLQRILSGEQVWHVK